MTDPQLHLFGASTAAQSKVAAADKTMLVSLAARLPARLRIGMSSWSFPGWTGLVYAQSYGKATLATAGLPAYAQHPLLRAVGLDRTYYDPIDATVFSAYAASVPDDFRFLVKAHELCTIHRYPLHPRYGGMRGTTNRFFLDTAYASDAVVAPAVHGLGAKLGAILFQFSPQDVAALGGSASFAPALARFLRGLPVGPLYAVEIRNAELFTPRYVAALADSGAVHCFSGHPTMQPIERQARALTAFAGRPLVMRWLLREGYTYETAEAAFAPFDRLAAPDPETRRAVVELIGGVTTDVLVIINNNAEGSAPLSAVALAEMLAAL